MEFVHNNEVGSKDIIWGYSSPRIIKDHYGNKCYKRIIKRSYEKYQASTKKDKTDLSRSLVQKIMGGGSRFLIWNPSTKYAALDAKGEKRREWRVLDPKTSQEKVSVALKNCGKSTKVQRTRSIHRGMFDKPIQITECPFFEELKTVQQEILLLGYITHGRTHNSDAVITDATAVDISERMEVASPPPPSWSTRSTITSATHFDVYRAKGTQTGASRRPGNALYVKLYKANISNYRDSSCRLFKKRICESIFLAIRQMGGRFLIQNKKNWMVEDEEVTKKKIAQALRDGDRFLRGVMMNKGVDSIDDDGTSLTSILSPPNYLQDWFKSSSFSLEAKEDDVNSMGIAQPSRDGDGFLQGVTTNKDVDSIDGDDTHLTSILSHPKIGPQFPNIFPWDFASI